MNYPQYPQQPAQQGYPGQQGYAPPPQAPQQPAPGYPPPGYPPQYTQPYPPQPGYGVPQAQFQAPPEPPPMAPVTLSDFMSQPSTAEGKALAFEVAGTRYVGVVIRNITDADIDRQTNPANGTISRHNDDREKLVMKVPLLMAPQPAYPEGIGVLYVNASLRNELARAMEAAGVPAGAPRAGDTIDVTFTHEQQVRAGMSNRKVKRIVYTGGNGVPPELPGTPQQPPQQPYQMPLATQQFVQQNGGTVPPPEYPQPPVQQYQDPQAAQAFQQQHQQPSFPPQFQQPGPQVPGVEQQPQYQQYAQVQPVPQPPQGPPVPQYGQPQADWNPYAQQPQQAPPTQQGGYAPQQPGAPVVQPQQTAPPMQAAAPSNPVAPDGSPWPPDVPFRPGLTVDQARMAMVHNIPGPPQQ